MNYALTDAKRILMHSILQKSCCLEVSMNMLAVSLGFIPFIVLLSFLIHWRSLKTVSSSSARLEYSRVPYLGYSFLLVMVSWVLFIASPAKEFPSLLIPLGSIFAIIGDYFNLQHEFAQRITRNTPIFGGLLSFSITQICYSAAFCAFSSNSSLLSFAYSIPLIVLFVSIPQIVFSLRVYYKGMPARIVWGSRVYSCLLGFMAAAALIYAFAYGGFWILIACGGVLYLISDSILGETTVHGRHPRAEYQLPWITYLAAQGCIIIGYGLLSP